MKRILKYLMCFSLLAVISISSIGCSYLIVLKDKIKNEDSAVESTLTEESAEESECEHEFASREIIVEGNCTTETQSKRTCKLCGYVKITNDGYYHENVTLIDGYPATCEQEGLTSGYECQDCGYIEGMQTIDKLPHIDTDNNGRCDTCLMPLVGQLNEVPVTAGTTIANKWFRFYRPEEKDTFDFTTLNLAGFYNGQSVSYQYVVGGIEYSRHMCNLYHIGPLQYIGGIEIYYCDEYIDIYFKEGTYDVIRESSSSKIGTVTIDADDAFGEFKADSALCYELVKGE